ncbi:UNVERIFIED_CONTAM: hypothetical protein FKN15_046481 [Acipenser sinensis]
MTVPGDVATWDPGPAMGGPDTKDAVPPLVLQTAATLAMVFGDGSSCLSGYLTQAVLGIWDSTRVDARCTHLDARPFDARRVDASTLGARTATLDASAIQRSVHVPRRSTLRRLTLGASTLDARCAQLDARRSVHAPRRSTPRRSARRRLDTRCTHRDA